MKVALSFNGLNKDSATVDRSAFNLIELLVVIAIIGVLAALLLPALSRAKEQGRRIVCLNNVHQLQLAIRMYWDDNADISPAANHIEFIWKSDWVYWDDVLHSMSEFRPGAASSLVSGVLIDYLRKPMAKLLWCPSDRTLPRYLSDPTLNSPVLVPSHGYIQGYPFSYGLSDPSGAVMGPRENWQHGIASIIRSDNKGFNDRNKPSPDATSLIYFKATGVKNPSQKLVSAEKLMLYEMTRAQLTGNVPGAGESAFSSQWQWPYDRVARRHNGRSNVTFADGHAQTVRPEYCEESELYDPLK